MRYLLWMVGYFGPLLVMLLHEAEQFGFMDRVKEQLLDPLTYAEIMAEVFIANVILSDIMYSNLYVERRRGEDGESAAAAAAAAAAGGGVSRPSSPDAGTVIDGYDQVLRDANLESFVFIPGFDSLEALRRGNRDDLIKSGLDAAQAAAVFTALGRYDASQHTVTDQPADSGPREQSEGVVMAEGGVVSVEKLQQNSGMKLVLLVLCPLLLLMCGVLSSLQVLQYIDSFPWVSRELGLGAPHPIIDAETLTPPPVADNGHPCPWDR